jgi:L-lactate dehydrogenase
MRDSNPVQAEGASRVSIVGCGNVGTASAYALLHSASVRELVLLDQNAKKAEGEAMDLQHAVSLGRPMRVFSGTYRGAARSSLVVLTAGAPNKPGESRLDLLHRNALCDPRLRVPVEGRAVQWYFARCDQSR